MEKAASDSMDMERESIVKGKTLKQLKTCLRLKASHFRSFKDLAPVSLIWKSVKGSTN